MRRSTIWIRCAVSSAYAPTDSALRPRRREVGKYSIQHDAPFSGGPEPILGPLDLSQRRQMLKDVLIKLSPEHRLKPIKIDTFCQAKPHQQILKSLIFRRKARSDILPIAALDGLQPDFWQQWCFCREPRPFKGKAPMRAGANADEISCRPIDAVVS